MAAKSVDRELARNLRREFGATAQTVASVFHLLDRPRVHGRTIERWWLTDDRGDEPWSLATADADDARYVLPLVQRLAEAQGEPATLTVREADWVCRLSRAAPGIDPLYALLLAGDYMERERLNQSSEDLDLFVSFEPWEDMPRGPFGASSDLLLRRVRFGEYLKRIADGARRRRNAERIRKEL